MISIDKWEKVCINLNRLGIACTPYVTNPIYRRKRLRKFISYRQEYYAYILGSSGCYKDTNDYIEEILNSDNMQDRIIEFILTYTEDDLTTNHTGGN